jgi:hypothetical protein
MMERTQTKKWWVVLFFSSAGLLFGYFVYFLASGITDPAYGQWLSNSQPAPAVAQTDDSFLLPKGEGLVVDRLKIIYRGAEARAINIDLVLMDLDGQYAYRHKIPIEDAKRGFFLSGRRFRVASFNSQKVLLMRGPN